MKNILDTMFVGILVVHLVVRWSMLSCSIIYLYLVLQIQLPSYVDGVRDKLAENIHELWAMGKIEQGWLFSGVSILVNG